MELLTAVNLIMPKLGERPVTSLEVAHPTLAILLPILEQTRRKTLNRGWWFNKYEYEAFPDPDGFITLGADTLSFVPLCGTYALRGLRLFNPATLDFVFESSVKGVVTQDVEFDLLPESTANYVFYTACVEAYATDLGVTQELAVWQQNAAQGWSDHMAEHLRQKKHNTRRTRAWRKYMGALQA